MKIRTFQKHMFVDGDAPCRDTIIKQMDDGTFAYYWEWQGKTRYIDVTRPAIKPKGMCDAVAAACGLGG